MSGFPYDVTRGRPLPPGAIPDDDGVNFSLLSENATGMQLLLFEKHDDPEPSQVISYDPKMNRTFHSWHVYVEGLKPGTIYGYRVDGPEDLHGGGHRYNRNKVLLDPYARGNVDTLWERGYAVGDNDNVKRSIRSVVVDTRNYDWEGDEPLKRPMSETVIYEMHVRGYTASPTSSVTNPGTFLGVAQKVDHLRDLGVTAVELLPVFDFDQTEVLRTGPDGTLLVNYWGYDPYSHFAPQSWYTVSPDAGGQINEFRDMVKTLHKAGIEVILDVVFNHTTEGNHLGPTICFKGIDNSVYYILSPKDRQYYMDFTGCGNTFSCNHPIVQKYVLDSLEFWVREMHVDGFRFDLASILSRGPDGRPMEYPPVLWAIELSEHLADAKVIAEAWDAGGLYQVGSFTGWRWSEWNGKYRDDVRSFVKGDKGKIKQIATRVAGSSDLFQMGERPQNSINFVTAHDGFTLNDLVSYNEKHNELNGEDNRDGANDNQSWNCGVEGPTDDPAINALRDRQVKNFFAILMLSQGVPMILGGDEIRRTQNGNNNSYCQDQLNWFDWGLAEKHAETLRFAREMIAFRARHPGLRRTSFFSGDVGPSGMRDISWHGADIEEPGWDDPESVVLGFTIGRPTDEDSDLHVMMNVGDDFCDMEIPALPGRLWHLAIDTSLVSPDDILPPGTDHPFSRPRYRVNGHTVVVLESRVQQPTTRKRASARSAGATT